MRLPFLLLRVLLCLACLPAHAVYLNRVNMVSPSSGWAIGTLPGRYVLYRTNDGGRHWADVSPPGFARVALYDEDTEDEAVGSAFPNAQRAWVAADEASRDDKSSGTMHLWRSGDGGAHWHESRFRTRMVGDSLYLQFLDPQHGVLLALGGPAAGLMAKKFYRTGDGGRTWRHMTSPDSVRGSFYPTGMTFRTPSDGWITATYHGEPDAPFLHTRDGGRTWRQQTLPIPSLYQGGYANTDPPQFFGAQRRDGLVLAHFVDHTSRLGDVAMQALFATHDGGAHWQRSGALPITETVDDGASVTFVDPRSGWVADTHRHLFATRDGGRTWRRITRHLGPEPPTGEEASEWTQLDFVTPRRGWALFRRRTARTFFADLYRTDDGGFHWAHVANGSAPNALYAVTQRRDWP